MKTRLLTKIMVVVEKLPITLSSRQSRQINNVGLQVCMSYACVCVFVCVIPSHRFPLGLGSLFLKLGKFSAIMNCDQQLPHQQSSQTQQENRPDDRSNHYQDIRTFKTLYTHENTHMRKTFIYLYVVIDSMISVLHSILQTASLTLVKNSLLVKLYSVLSWSQSMRIAFVDTTKEHDIMVCVT